MSDTIGSNNDSVKEVVIYYKKEKQLELFLSSSFLLEIKVKRFIYVSSVKTLHTLKNAGCQWEISTRFSFHESLHHRWVNI